VFGMAMSAVVDDCQPFHFIHSLLRRERYRAIHSIEAAAK